MIKKIAPAQNPLPKAHNSILLLLHGIQYNKKRESRQRVKKEDEADRWPA